MLVLTRKEGEAIAIGDDIKVIVMQIKGKQVRIGIKADQKTAVHREEVYQRVKIENEKASDGQNHDLLNQAKDVLLPAIKKKFLPGIVIRKNQKPEK